MNSVKSYERKLPEKHIRIARAKAGAKARWQTDKVYLVAINGKKIKQVFQTREKAEKYKRQIVPNYDEVVEVVELKVGE